MHKLSLSEIPPEDPQAWIAIGFESKNRPHGLYWCDYVARAHSDVDHFTRHLYARVEGIAHISKIDTYRSGFSGAVYLLVKPKSLETLVEKMQEHADAWDCDLDLSKVPDPDDFEQDGE